MSVQIGNREKLAGLTILCLVSIGATHWFLFMPKAREYRTAFEDYQRERMEWQRMPSLQSKPEIEKYIEETQAMEDYIHTLSANLNLRLEPKHFATGPKAVTDLQKDLLDVIYKVINLRKTYPDVKMSFMDWRANALPPSYGMGWDIPKALPPQQAGGRMWDQIDKLREVELELRHMRNPIDRTRKRNEYNGYLVQLGIMPTRFDAIKKHGDIVLLVKKLAHAQLVWDRKGPDQARGVTVPIEDREQLFLLFEIHLPESETVLFQHIRQFEFLLKMVELADKSKVEEIQTVNLKPLRMIDQILENDKPLLVPEMHWDQMTAGGGAEMWDRYDSYDDEGDFDDDSYSRRMRYRGRAGWPGAGQGLAPGVGGVPGTPTPTPTPQPLMGGSRIGYAMPIEIEFDASWQNALDYLYVISHNHNPFELDRVHLQTITGAGGKIRTVGTVVPMAWVEGLDMFYRPAGTTATVATTAATPAPAAAPPAGATGTRRIGGGGAVR